MDSHLVVLSSRHALRSSGNNANFTVASRSIHNALSVKKITPVLVRFFDSFTTYPEVVYVCISLYANGNLLEMDQTHNARNVVCIVPMTDVTTGQEVSWEPQDKDLHTIVNSAHVVSDESIQVQLYDENFNLLVANPNNHIDIVVELENDDEHHT